MKFSVIISAHNEESVIRKALESIKAQSYTNYELIVVCDNCTDDTEKIAREYPDKDNHSIDVTRYALEKYWIRKGN